MKGNARDYYIRNCIKTVSQRYYNQKTPSQVVKSPASEGGDDVKKCPLHPVILRNEGSSSPC
jgi:hypothetical protein